MTTNEKLDAVAKLWLGPPPWDLTAEAAVRATARLGQELRQHYPQDDPNNTGVSIQREVLAAAITWAKACVESMGLPELAIDDEEAAKIVNAIEFEVRTRLLRTLDPQDVPLAFADGNLDGYLETCAELALKGDIAETGVIVAGGRP